MRDVMRLPDLKVEPFVDPHQLVALEVDAKADGRIMVSRFIEEWLDGRNRFSRSGEQAYVAKRGGRICGVCGLNRDPFAGSDAIGRVRRLYVAVRDRRHGVGSAVIDQLMADACGVYTWIHLRTYDAQAAAFYEAMGFERIVGDPKCTHRRLVA